MAKAKKPTPSQLKAVEGTKADEAHHAKGVKEGSRKDMKLDKELAVKAAAKKAKK
jgi:hypothetical protein